MEIDYYQDPIGHCVQAFKSPNADVRYNAADVLRGMGVDAEPALKVLCSHMEKDVDIEVQRQCAFALIDIGYALKGKALEALPYLRNAEQHSDDELSDLAKSAIQAITT